MRAAADIFNFMNNLYYNLIIFIPNNDHATLQSQFWLLIAQVHSKNKLNQTQKTNYSGELTQRQVIYKPPSKKNTLQLTFQNQKIRARKFDKQSRQSKR